MLTYLPLRLSCLFTNCSTARMRSGGPAVSGQLDTMACLDASNCCCFWTWSRVCADRWSSVLIRPPCLSTMLLSPWSSLRICSSCVMISVVSTPALGERLRSSAIVPG